MKKIFWQKDKVGIISDHLISKEHSHGLIQLFLSLEDTLEIEVEGVRIECSCIVVNHNIRHAFIADEKPCYSLVFGVTSAYETSLINKLGKSKYLIYDGDGIKQLQIKAKMLLENANEMQYQLFLEELRDHLQITKQAKQFDKRIVELIEYLNHCDCDDHTVALFAQKVYLSPSRLAHLFKSEVGISLKSYIGLHQMNKAFEALLNNHSITEAALIAGFDTPSHFATMVKRMTGMTTTTLMKNSEILKVEQIMD